MPISLINSFECAISWGFGIGSGATLVYKNSPVSLGVLILLSSPEKVLVNLELKFVELRDFIDLSIY